jgi:hypothetical protein
LFAPFGADQIVGPRVVYMPTAGRVPLAAAEVADPSGATELVT